TGLTARSPSNQDNHASGRRTPSPAATPSSPRCLAAGRDSAMTPTFDLQGHRGARGLKPENTLPSFEAALDSGVTSLETDLHLTRDSMVILCHDPIVPGRLCRAPAGDAPLRGEPLLISSLTLGQLRGLRADRNPDPERFPEQDSG